MATALENPYLRDAVLTATPEQLQLMLYDGAIRFCNQARDAIQRKDFEASYERLTRAQNIILEMQNGLRHDVNPELCGRVASIYGFLYRKLLDANIHRSIADIDDALRVLQVERETWQILVEKVARVRESGQDLTTADPERSADTRESTFTTCG
jgi:flagellar protein FliS